ncbi:MAG TPA: AAA family ATPase [Candidatus Margulisiibacteriota bacterium]|nr:AAA family ATPase [Candidatus Margulisiibacteriota bacterium]
MHSAGVAKRPQRPDARDAAREYIRRGWAVVPVPARRKGPVRDGWQRGGFTADDVDPDGNLGLLTGERSGGLVDVDLDVPEAIAAAPYRLPETDMVHGRASSRASHWWYDAPGTETVRRRDPDGTTLVETRSSGGQTVVPPSLHEDTGELIHWERTGEPARASAETLARARDWIASAAMLARRWADGSRHDISLALAGLLLRGGMTRHEAERLVEAVARVGGDGQWRDRVRAVRDTYAETGPTTGGPTLAELLRDGEAVVPRLCEWLGLRGGKDHADAGLLPQPPYAPDLGEFLAVEFPRRDHIFQPVLQRQGLAMVHAWRGVGKTYFTLTLGLAAAAGAGCFHWSVSRPWRVLYVDGEMSGVDMQTRLAQLAKGMGLRPEPGVFRIVTPDLQPRGIPDLSTTAGREWLDQIIADRELLFLDNLSSLVRCEDNDDAPWLPLLGWLLGLRASGRSVVLVHHDGKNRSQRGISRREDHLDTTFHLKTPDDQKTSDGARFVVHFRQASRLSREGRRALQSGARRCARRQPYLDNGRYGGVCHEESGRVVERGLHRFAGARTSRHRTCDR